MITKRTSVASGWALAGLAIALATGPRLNAQARVDEFIPFDKFMGRNQLASSLDLRTPHSKVQGAAAFDEMHRHLLKMYRGVQVKHSFVKDSSHFDCVPVEQQPAVRLLGLDGIASEPPKSLLGEVPAGGAAPVDTAQQVDEFGNVIGCEASTIPMRRVTLEEMSRFGSLRQFLEKKPETPDSPSESDPTVAPAVSAPAHKYAYTQQNVDNLGGNSNISIWSPYVNTAAGEVFSPSQEWYVGGSGAAIQTAEVGWQNFPSKYGSQNSVLFIYWTADNYSKTGCYNLDCPAFVQVAETGILGSSFSAYSTVGGEQHEFSARFYLYAGNWWLAIDGTWIGYYPGSLYQGGQLTKYAQSIKFGTESVGTTTWPREGSGYFATSGWTNAAYQRNVFYADTTGTLKWAALTSVNPSPACYSASTPMASSTSGWTVYFFVGGPGGSGC